jgi:hypothetical protein
MDLRALSEGFDALLAGARRVVREAAVRDLLPDAALAKMASVVDEGVRPLADGVSLIVDEPERAALQARIAITTIDELERMYRDAMLTIALSDDAGESHSRRVLYQECISLGEGLIRIAKRIRYATAGVGAALPRTAGGRR